MMAVLYSDWSWSFLCPCVLLWGELPLLLTIAPERQAYVCFRIQSL